MPKIPLHHRERKVDLEKLAPEQIVQLSHAVGKTVASRMAEVRSEIEALLDIYNMKLVLHYAIEPKEQPKEESEQG